MTYTPHNPNPDDYPINEDERIRQRQEERRRTRMLERLQQLHIALDNNVIAALGAKEKSRIAQQRLAKHEQTSPSLANIGPREAMTYTIFVLVAIAVICLNYFLINASVNYLASMPFEDEDAWQIPVATVLIPVVLLIFEIWIGVGRTHAIDEESDDVWKWDLAGGVMIFVTPLMIVGAMLAREDWFASYNLVTSLGMIALAGVTDAVIIFSGGHIYNALSFIGFNQRRQSIKRDIKRFEAEYKRYEGNVRRIYIPYGETRNDYNRRYPDSPPYLPLSPDVTQFINEIHPGAIAEDAPTVNTHPHNPPTNLPNPQPPPEEDEPFSAVPVPRPPTPPPNNDNGIIPEQDETLEDLDAENDYLRTLMNGNIRNQERTLQPD